MKTTHIFLLLALAIKDDFFRQIPIFKIMRDPRTFSRSFNWMGLTVYFHHFFSLSLILIRSCSWIQNKIWDNNFWLLSTQQHSNATMIFLLFWKVKNITAFSPVHISRSLSLSHCPIELNTCDFRLDYSSPCD